MNIKWHHVIKKSDVIRYERMIRSMISSDDKNKRISICYDILHELEDDYPSILPYIEDEIIELANI